MCIIHSLVQRTLLSVMQETGRRLGDHFWEHWLDVLKKKVALPVPVHFVGMDHRLEDMQVAVIRAGLPEQDKRRREEMSFIHNFGTRALGGLNQDFSFMWLAHAHTCLFLRTHFQILKFSAITNSHIFRDEGSIAETSKFYLQLSYHLPTVMDVPRLKKTWISACPVDEHVSHIACPRSLLAHLC